MNDKFYSNSTDSYIRFFCFTRDISAIIIVAFFPYTKWSERTKENIDGIKAYSTRKIDNFFFFFIFRPRTKLIHHNIRFSSYAMVTGDAEQRS